MRNIRIAISFFFFNQKSENLNEKSLNVHYFHDHRKYLNAPWSFSWERNHVEWHIKYYLYEVGSLITEKLAGCAPRKLAGLTTKSWQVFAEKGGPPLDLKIHCRPACDIKKLTGEIKKVILRISKFQCHVLKVCKNLSCVLQKVSCECLLFSCKMRKTSCECLCQKVSFGWHPSEHPLYFILEDNCISDHHNIWT